MQGRLFAIAAGVSLAVAISIGPASAGLLGKVLGGDGGGGLTDTLNDVVDTVTDTVDTVTGGGGGGLGDIGDSVVTTGNGDAGSGGLVNFGIGDDGTNPNTSNVLDVKTANTVPGNSGGALNAVNKLLPAEVQISRNGSSSGGLTGLLNGSPLTVGLSLGSLGLDVSTPGLGDALGGLGGLPLLPGGDDGTAGGGGQLPGGNGGGIVPGGNGGNGVRIGGNGRTLVSSLGPAASAVCSLDMARWLLQTAADVRLTKQTIAGWQRAASVKIMPVKLCTTTRNRVAKILAASSKITSLRNAAASDMLIMASLSRAHADPRRVFAVVNSGGLLTVYVY